MFILLALVAIMFIPPLRKLVRDLLSGMNYTVEALNDSMKTGAISILDANEKQRLAIDQDRATRARGKSADEMLNEILKASQPK